MQKYYKHKVENLINVSKIVTIHYMECQKDFFTLGESHNFWEILYLDKGNLLVKTDEREVSMREGDIIFHAPNEFHAVKADGIHAPNLFIVSFDCNSDAIKILQKKHYKLQQHLKFLITNILNEANDSFQLAHFNPNLKRLELKNKPNLGGQQMIRTYLEQFLILLIREENTSTHKQTFFMTNEELTNQIVQQVVQFLNENIENKLSIDQICLTLGYGKTHLSILFKKHTGQTLMQYFKLLKLQKAKQLLRERNLNCAQISELLGFDTPSYFSKCFKDTTDMTPRQYIESTHP